jgi:hypothetical protein
MYQSTHHFWADQNNPFIADSMANIEDDEEVSKLLARQIKNESKLHMG